MVGERWRRLCGMESGGKVSQAGEKTCEKKGGWERMLKDEERGGKMGKKTKEGRWYKKEVIKL